MLDAPVTGSSPRAEDGTLTIMVGGEPDGFARARPLLETMGELIVHVGELGQGQMLKLINNSLGAANAAAVAEALLLARATGIDLDALVEVTSAGSGASAQLALKSGPMREHDYTTAVQDRPHAQGRAPVPGGGGDRGRAVPGGGARSRRAGSDDRTRATASRTTRR